MSPEHPAAIESVGARRLQERIHTGNPSTCWLTKHGSEWLLWDTGVSTPGHTPGHQSLLIHLRKSGFIILSGDVAHLEEHFERNIVPSLNTDQAQSIASMTRVRQLIATYQATFFINHDKSQT